jgi:hypothetical protein
MSWRVLMMVGLTVTPVLGQAQTRADSVAIVEAAARWYASQAPHSLASSSSRVGFLRPRRPRSDPIPTAGEAEAAQHGAQVLRAALIPIDSLVAYLCDRSKPADCGPGKFDLVVDVRVTKITGNTGEVSVMQWTTDGPGLPGQRTASLGWIVRFVRSSNGWAFNQVLMTSMS